MCPLEIPAGKIDLQDFQAFVSTLKGNIMRYIPNILTGLRVLGSVVLLFLQPLSAVFFTVYSICGATDILDGYIARKTKNVSKLGAALDSTADMVFIAVLLFLFLPIVSADIVVVLWIAGIALIRFLSIFVGYLKYRTLTSLHTYANKATGLLLFLFPFLYSLFGSMKAEYLVLIAASLSAFEEIAINLTSRTLDVNVKGIFFKK